ncbi:MAG TPA: DUF6279 family lipoprotein [Ramlibacter sp.]|nr:DUF6279 family lipoprotein [Ramlibacter sp.]
MRTLGLRLAGIIVALACAVALAGCSAVKLGYGNGVNLAYWWLNGYLDFSDAQGAQARGELERLHAWHRQQELPRVIELLARAEQLAPGAVSPEQACAIVAEGRARLEAVAERADPAVVAIAMTLTPAQLRHLERKQRKNIDKFRRDWIDATPAEQKERRVDFLQERFEMIYGRLEAPQRAVLRRGVEQSIFEPQRMLDDRQRRQQDLLQTLRQVIAPGQPVAEARTLLRGYLDRMQRPPDAAHRTWQNALLQENCRLFAALHESTTPQQREQAVRRLRGYQRDVRELAGSL